MKAILGIFNCDAKVGLGRRLAARVVLCSGLIAVAVAGFAPGVRAQGTTLSLAATSGGKAVTSVPLGTAVTLTATAAPTTSATVDFCNAALIDPATKSCSGAALVGSAALTPTQAAAVTFTPGAGAQGYVAVIGGATPVESAVANFTVTTTKGAKLVTSTLLTSSGSAGNYSLTATVEGFGIPASGALPSGTITFSDTTNGSASVGSGPLVAGGATASWQAAGTLGGVAQPQTVVAADFNGDGILDLAVTGVAPEAAVAVVGVYIGNGDGTFGTPTLFPSLGSLATGLGVGNFGGKGGDLVVGGNDTSSPSAITFLGDGSGNFAAGELSFALPNPAVSIAVGANTSYVAVVNGTTSGTVSIFSSTGVGEFSGPVNVSVGASPQQIVALTAGLAVTTNTSGAGSVTILKQGAGTTFTVAGTVNVGMNAMGIAVGDFTGGGAQDLVVANQGSNTVSILMPSSAAAGYSVTATVKVGNGPVGVAVGDFNGDGKADIAVTNGTDGTVSILIGNGDGTFTAGATLAAGTMPGGLVVADLDGNGSDDVAALNVGGNSTSTFVSSVTQTSTVTVSDVAIVGTGSHEIVANYPGDANYVASVSAAVSLMAETPAAPTLTSISPTSATAGGANFTLTAIGTSFVSGSVVQWNGAALTTTFVSATKLTAAVPASDITKSGTSTVTVFTAAPGGGTSTSQTFTISAAANPAPTLASISPASATAGAAALNLTVTGTNFVSSSVVDWNGADLVTTFVSATQLTAMVPANLLTNAGTASVTVFTATPGGGTSTAQTFTVNAAVTPTPTLAALSPTSAAAGGAAFTLTLTGTNFISTSVAEWNGAGLTTTFISATQLTAMVPATDIASMGTASVTVFNPNAMTNVVKAAAAGIKSHAVPSGNTSNALTFTVTAANNPVPTLGAISPISATAGGAAFTLNVTGTNFISSSMVRWNGAALTTTFVSATQLTAAVPASDIASSGTSSVTVFNGTPGGGASGAQTFTINAANNPVPTLASISPNSATAGGATFTLTATGTNFVSASMVQWNGTALTTTFVSATQLTAAVPVSDIASAGTAMVTVLNPTPGGGASGAQTFTIAGFALTPTSGMQTVTAGQPAMYTIGTPAVGGFTGQITFAASGLPTGAVASFNPPMVAPGTSTVLTITTTGSGATGAVTPRNSEPMTPRSPAGLPVLFGILLLAGIGAGAKLKVGGSVAARRFGPAFALIVLSVVVACFAGCSGGSGGKSSGGTPAGTYNIAVTGTSGSVVVSSKVVLVVQ
jgi:YVTN family beta-propeller protein